MPPKTLEEAYAEGYKKGFNEGVDHKRGIIPMSAELEMPVTFIDFDSQQQKEIIGSIVDMEEYKQFFRVNILQQSMLKHRQARMHTVLNDPISVRVLHEIGNAYSDLVVFYDNLTNLGETQINSMQRVDYNISDDDE